MTPSGHSYSGAWWATNPATGEPVQVLPAELVEGHDRKAQDALLQVARMREGATRLRPLARRAVVEGGAEGDQARRELPEAIDWLAAGAPVTDEGDEPLRVDSRRPTRAQREPPGFA